MTYEIDPDGLIYAGLDLAKSSGAVVGNPFMPPHAETWRLAGDYRAQNFIKLRANLIPFLIRWRPRKVFIEMPMNARQMNSLGTPIETQIALTGYVAIAEEECDRQGIETMLVDRQNVLGHFTGRKRYKNTDDGKRACVVRCKQLGYPIEGFDQADAAALWDYGCAQTLPKAFALHGARRAMPQVYENALIERTSRPRTGQRGKRTRGGKTLFDLSR